MKGRTHRLSHRGSRGRFAIAAAAAAAALGPIAPAVDATVWDAGFGSTFTWSQGGNWDTNIEPTATDDVFFPTPVPQNFNVISLSSGEFARSLVFQDSYELSGGNLTFGGTGTGNIVTVAGTNNFISSVLGGTVGLSKGGAGTLTLQGANTYTGGTTLNLGTLSIDADNNLGDGSGGITFSNGATLKTTASFSSSRTVTLGSGGGTIDAASGPLLTLAGVISGAGALTISGTTIAGLTGVNTYTGGTNVNAGILRIGADNNLGNASGVITFNGGWLDLTSGFATSRSITLNAGGGFFSPDATITLNGVISGTGALTNNDGGSLRLNAVNTYSGGTVVRDGTVIVSADNNLGHTSGGISLGGGSFSGIGSLFAVGSFSTARPMTLVASGAGINVAPSTVLTASGQISGTGALAKHGNGTLVLTNVNSYSGGTTVSAGTLQISNNSHLGDISGGVTINNGATLATTGSISTGRNFTLSGSSGISVGSSTILSLVGVISGAGQLVKTGSGTLNLIANNTYSGGTVVNAGIVVLGTQNNEGGAGTGAITLGDTSGSATAGLQLVNQFSAPVANDIVVRAGSSGAVTIFGASLAVNELSGDISLNKDLVINASSSSGGLIFTGVINDGAGSFGITATGGNSNRFTRLTNANTYDGGTTVITTLELEHSSAAGTGAILVGNTSAGSFPATVRLTAASGGLNVANPITIRSGSSGIVTLSSTNGSGVSTYSGNITLNKDLHFAGGSDPGSLAVTGAISGGFGINAS